MKSPLISVCCCLLGIAIAGVPLVYFTSAPLPRAEAALPLNAEGQGGLAASPVLLRYTGRPVEISIWHEGRLLAKHAPGDEAGVAELTLALPELKAGDALELELAAAWPADRREHEAITLEISPPKLPTRCDTQWAEPGAGELHSVYTFTW